MLPTATFVPSVPMSTEGSRADSVLECEDSFDLTLPVGAPGDHMERSSREMNGYKVIRRWTQGH